MHFQVFTGKIKQGDATFDATLYQIKHAEILLGCDCKAKGNTETPRRIAN